MTIPASNRRMPAVATNGVQTVFAFDFKVFADTDVEVVYESAAGTQTILVLSTDYTVSRNANQDTSPGGTITTTSARATGLLTILGNLAYQQGIDVPNAGPFFGDTVENALDYLAILIQQVQEQVLRSFKVTPIDGTIAELPSATQRASKYLYFDAFGNPTTSAVVTPGVLSVTPFGESLVEAANAAAAMTILLEGSSRRITSDFSNATLATRTLFQSSTTNGTTVLGVIPNGSSPTSGFLCLNNSNTAAAQFGFLQAVSAEVQLVSGRTGAASFLPLRFFTSDVERMSILAGGQVTIGPAGIVPVGGSLLTVLGGNIQLSPGTAAQPGLRLQQSTGVVTLTAINNNNDTFSRIDILTGATALLSFREDNTIWTNGNTLPVFQCRAWSNFNGQGTLNRRAEANISAVTDLGVGSFQVTMANAMPDANYVIEVSASLIGGGASYVSLNVTAAGAIVLPTATQFQFLTVANNAAYDPQYVNVAVFR